MAKSTVIDTVNFPSAGLSALINGDYSGIDDDSELCAEVEGFIKFHTEFANDNGCTVIFSDKGDHFYTKYPEFGLPCDCTEVDVIYVKK